MKTKYGHKVVAHYEKELDGEYFEVIVTRPKNYEYYNIHVISERYRDDEINTLKLQEHKDYVNDNTFTAAKLASYLMEHFIWDRFYSEFGAAGISVSIESEEN